VFGASGDLSARKLLPALFNLSNEGLLPQRGSIVGAAPVEMDEAGFIDFARDSVRNFSRTKPTAKALAAFTKRLRFVRLDPTAGLRDLRSALTLDRRLAYLAVPPSASPGCARRVVPRLAHAVRQRQPQRRRQPAARAAAAARDR